MKYFQKYSKYKRKVSYYITKGHERTIRTRKNILYSILIKSLNIAIGLILVPLTINYLGSTKYGIWLTLSSIISWFGFFDIGLGHGLRNRFTEALAVGNKELAKTYVSTTYAILTIIIVFVLLLFLLFNNFLNWNYILNVGEEIVKKEELTTLVTFVFLFFCFSFILKIITTILTADQRPALASFFDFFGKLISLILIFILTKTSKVSLLYLGLIYSSMPVFVLLSSSLFFFNRDYKEFKPSIKYINFKYAKDLINLGLMFFIIQISVIILYQTNNIIITQLLGPEKVTTYNIPYKYLNVLLMFFSILITPYWSAITEAWTKKEYNWIKISINKLIYFWAFLFIIGFILIVFSKTLYRYWLGYEIAIPYSITSLIGVWISIDAWKRIFNTFLNAIGRIKIQMIVELLAATINIPVCIFLGKKYGLEGILIGNIIVTGFSAWVYPLLYYRIIKNI